MNLRDYYDVNYWVIWDGVSVLFTKYIRTILFIKNESIFFSIATHDFKTEYFQKQWNH